MKDNGNLIKYMEKVNLCLSLIGSYVYKNGERFDGEWQYSKLAYK